MRTLLQQGRVRVLLALALTGVAAVSASLANAAAGAASSAPILPPIRHVFVINIENKGYSETYGPASPAPYLANTLVSQGVLLSQYYGIGHESNDNYLAQISGQGPNPDTQSDCQYFTNFVQTGSVAPGQAVGQGCVFPSTVTTVADQLHSAGLTWRGYMEDMGNDPSRESSTCAHPAINAKDNTQSAETTDQYATRHNPFVYFHSIIDSPTCNKDVVPLGQLPTDLASASTTPNLVYITPNLCDDGHDAPCIDGRPGGLISANSWLSTWIPKILASPAYKRDGLLVVATDESDGPQSDSTACCGEGPGPNTAEPGITGPGGGLVGAVALSRYIRPGSNNDTPYNHYSLLATTEQLFGLPRLGYAASATPFGLDVFTGYKP